MSDLSTKDLRDEIYGILKSADLSVVSAKKVREEVEKKFNCSLLSRKKEFDSIVMEFINQQQEELSDDSDNDGDGNDSPSSDEVSSEEQFSQKGKKRSQNTPKKAVSKKKRKSINADNSNSDSDGGSDSDFELPKKKAVKKKSASSGGATGGNRRQTGFTRAYNLSPELAALMGAEALPRFEVVKKLWAIIKERDLYDPKNKQYAICDDELLKVMKVKRFRTFGMLKHLKPHFLN